MTLDEILNICPFSMADSEKHAMLNDRLQYLTRWHYFNCPEYRSMLDAKGIDINNLPDYESLPFLPVRLFKKHDLMSCAKTDVIKTLTSSGTTGQNVSKIFLDRKAAANQTKCLTRIISHFIGPKRLPMLIFDSCDVIKNRAMFSARGAGILGFSMFGSKRMYAFDHNMDLDIDGLKLFLEEHKGERIFMFGFTFMIWQHFYKQLLKNNFRTDLSNGILIHGGGWKKLINESVSPAAFKQALHDICGVLPANVHDYYGMVEQTGTVYMECPEGHLHCSAFSDIIIRDPKDFSIVKKGERGLIEVVSVLPESYPGHILLTEDEGVYLGVDDCPCGLHGKYFKVEGRIRNAEIRGCSDTYASSF